MSLLTLDGSSGEGGGQILRTALALAMVTATPVRVEHIRKKRRKPGLLRQHLTCIEAATAITAAEVRGAHLGSLELEFRPGRIRAGAYEFAVGTAGSTTLVLQTVLPALFAATAPSTLTIRGGTHNPMAPPFEFLAHTYAPILARMGADVSLTLEQPGFYPAGGGCIRARVAAARLQPIALVDRGDHGGFLAHALLAQLPRSVGERQVQVIHDSGIPGPAELLVEEVQALSPGNALAIHLRFHEITEVVTTLGERGVRAEDVARRLVEAAFSYLRLDAPVDEFLADQLLLPLAIAGGGTFRTGRPSSHTRTNAAVIERVLPVRFSFTPEPGETWRVEVNSR
ncbi:MAG: RNA 3'-terminal phosphate cyclase [Planctomycetota bacterium]